MCFAILAWLVLLYLFSSKLGWFADLVSSEEPGGRLRLILRPLDLYDLAPQEPPASV